MKKVCYIMLVIVSSPSHLFMLPKIEKDVRDLMLPCLLFCTKLCNIYYVLLPTSSFEYCAIYEVLSYIL